MTAAFPGHLRKCLVVLVDDALHDTQVVLPDVDPLIARDTYRSVQDVSADVQRRAGQDVVAGSPKRRGQASPASQSLLASPGPRVTMPTISVVVP